MAFKKILVGLDGSENSFKALERAVDLARSWGAELHSVSVEEMPRCPEVMDEVLEAKEEADERFGAALRRADEIAKRAGIAIHSTVLVGHEVKQILELMKEGGFDLLVIGFMGHSALYDRVMGSTCQSLVRLAPCSVMVVK